MGPAGTTILWDMLVSSPGKIVDTIYISPMPVVRNILNIKNFMRKWHGDVSWSWGFWSDDLISKEESVFWFSSFFLNLGLETWEEVLDFLNFFSFLGSFPALSSWLRQFIDWFSKLAVRLDGDVFYTSNDSKEAVFTEMLTPGVSDFPELDSVFDTVSDDGNIMNDIGIVGHIMEDTSSIVFKCIWNSNTTSDWTSLIEFIHNSLFVLNDSVSVLRNVTVLIDSIDVILVWDPAALIGGAVSADEIISTFDSRIMTSSLIVGTGFIGYIVTMHPLIGSVSITTVATHVLALIITREDDLRSNDDIWERSVSSNLDPITEGRGSGKGPAGTAISWDMLLSGDSQKVCIIDVRPIPVVWKVLEVHDCQWLTDILSKSWALDMARVLNLGGRDSNDNG
jgi:hypothetical protein